MARSTGARNLPKLLLTKQTFDVFILISVKWNLSSYILYFIYMHKDGHSIRWNALHEDAYKFLLYIDQQLRSIYRTIYKQTVSAIKN